MFGDIYEKLLKDLQSAGNAGEFYTPRAVTQFIVEQVDPRLRETILDPACGTGGFLVCAIEHLRKQAKTEADERTIQDCFSGIEKKHLPHILCMTNLLLHGIDVPSNVRHDNTLARPLRDWGPKERVDVIVTNPPFGGMEEDGIESNYPAEFRTRETADLFLVLLMKILKPDRVLESVYTSEGRPFIEKVTGRGMANAFFRAIPAGDRYLLKLHGNLDNAVERVLNRAEYDLAYGNDGNIHFDCPLPKLLKRLFTSYSFMFLGCSLSADRTIQTFMRVAQQEGQDNLPHHYALLVCPAENARRQVIEQRLANAHISPLWYPEGEHEHVELILQLLLE